MIQGKLKRRLALLLPLALLAGCASTPELGGDPNLRVSQADAMPVPDRADLVTGARDYFVGPFDKLSISVFGIPELSQREVQVDALGRIYFPPAGTIEVSGSTPAEIAGLLANQLRANFVRNPEVTVDLKEAVSQNITIEGQVNAPGNYPVLGRMTLLRAMALSRGVNEFAKLDDVVVFRTVSGQRYAALYNLKTIRHGKHADPDLYANDIVVVGDSAARRLFKDISTLLPLVTTPVLLVDSITR